MHGMNWNDLYIFLTAVRSGSYSAAAKELGIDRTTVGRRVSALEKAIGAELYRYTPAGPEPTKAGNFLLKAASHMEAEMDKMRLEVSQNIVAEATIRIASSASIGVEFLELFEHFQSRHPAVSLEVMGQLDPIEAITQRKADLAIALIDKRPRRTEGLHIGTVHQARYCCKGTNPEKRLLWGHEMEISLPGQWTAANSSEDGAGVRVNNWPQMKQAVLAGMGSAWLWTFLADKIPNLVRIEEPEPRWGSELWLLHRAGFPVSNNISMIIDYLGTELRQMLKSAHRR